MSFFIWWLKEKLLSVVLFLSRFITPEKYAIQRVMLEYDTDGKPCDISSVFWKNEERYWDTEFEENDVNITWMYKNRMSILPYPSCVSNVAFRIAYKHNGELYKYITRDHNHCWPPKKTPGFHPPIKEAMAFMFDDTYMDVTKKMKRYAGPNSDFHGETLHFSDVVGEQCISVKLTNILGQTTTLKTGDTFSRKTLWVA